MNGKAHTRTEGAAPTGVASSDLYSLVPRHHRAAVRRFARCFGFDRDDLARFIRASYARGRG